MSSLGRSRTSGRIPRTTLRVALVVLEVALVVLELVLVALVVVFLHCRGSLSDPFLLSGAPVPRFLRLPPIVMCIIYASFGLGLYHAVVALVSYVPSVGT